MQFMTSGINKFTFLLYYDVYNPYPLDLNPTDDFEIFTDIVLKEIVKP